jgi:aspartyl-tRNA(Asn)/glutamyl-tRNA(Gln) amidotransferase subunit A
MGVLAYTFDGIFIGATWARDMRNLMVTAFVIYLATWWALRDYGNTGLWIALLTFLGVRGLRIAWSPTLGHAKVDREGADAVAAAAAQLAALGAHVEAVDPGFEDPLEITTGLWFAGAAAIWSGLTTEQQEVVDPDFRAEAELGARYSALDIHRLNLRRGELGSHLRQFMQRFDLIATPTLAVPAFDARPAGHTPMNPEAMLAWTPFSYPFNLSQQPACTIPCGLTTEGLPIGLQLVGPMFGDALVLRAAR